MPMPSSSADIFVYRPAGRHTKKVVALRLAYFRVPSSASQCGVIGFDRDYENDLFDRSMDKVELISGILYHEWNDLWRWEVCQLACAIESQTCTISCSRESMRAGSSAAGWSGPDSWPAILACSSSAQMRTA